MDSIKLSLIGKVGFVYTITKLQNNYYEVELISLLSETIKIATFVTKDKINIVLCNFADINKTLTYYNVN